MQVFVRGAAEKQDTKREIHHVTALKELERRYRSRDHVLSGGEVPTAGGGTYKPLRSHAIQDIPNLRKEHKLYKQQYERGAPQKFAPQTVNWMWKRAKQLKDSFAPHMTAWSKLHPVKNSGVQTTSGIVTKSVADYNAIRSNRTIERERAFHDRFDPTIREFKNIMRHLCPKDPKAANIEKYRKQ